eukprot:TRINITY_DN5094_c0_g1_i1.p1 TRINITY_DN5094_c0_g1~~TRINITY_DN5094_c0_g1_i1.p1  ORF type:complete len:168 (+),score=14.23 TRINITY_DN5094_c0_g1_i1:121-624(+)
MEWLIPLRSCLTKSPLSYLSVYMRPQPTTHILRHTAGLFGLFGWVTCVWFVVGSFVCSLHTTQRLRNHRTSPHTTLAHHNKLVEYSFFVVTLYLYSYHNFACPTHLAHHFTTPHHRTQHGTAHIPSRTTYNKLVIYPIYVFIRSTNSLHLPYSHPQSVSPHTHTHTT